MRQLSVSHLRGGDNLVKALELLPFEIVYRGKVLGVCVDPEHLASLKKIAFKKIAAKKRAPVRKDKAKSIRKSAR